MKRFIFSTLCVAVFFVGLGALVERTGARFKSDEKALALIAKARQAIGGDAAINGVKSLTIVGHTTNSVKVDGAMRSEEGETEIALQFPDKMMRSTKMGHDDGNGGTAKTINRQMDVVVTGDAPGDMKFKVTDDGRGDGNGNGKSTRIVIKKDGETVKELTGADAEKWIAEHGEVGAGSVKVFVKKPDGSVQVVDGAEGKIGDAANGGVIVRKVEGGNATFTTDDGKTVVIKTTDGSGENAERHVIVRTGDGEGATFKTDDGNTVFFKRSDGTAGEKVVSGDHVMLNRMSGAAFHGGGGQNEFLRTTLGLLLTAPAGMDVSYTYGGDGDVDGTSCDVVVAEFSGAAYKLYLSKASSLPVMMSYKGAAEPLVFTFKTKAPEGAGENPQENRVFARKVEGGPANGVETSVKYSDYRFVNGVQLPFKWTKTSGDSSETFDVTSYEINPSNIGEKFQGQKVMMRTAKPDNNK